MKLAPEVPSDQPALFQKVLGAAREELTARISHYMVFGTQLVGAQRVQSATAHAEVEGRRYAVTVTANDSGDVTRLKETFLNNIFNRAQQECKLTQIGRKFFDIGSRQQVDPEQGISVVTG